MTKFCPRCQLEKPTTDFYKSSASKDGLRWCCKPCLLGCNKTRRVGNIEAQRAWQRANYTKHAPKIRKANAEYAQGHKAQKAAYDKDYRKRNADRIRAGKRSWEAEHRADPTFKLRRNMRRRLHHQLMGNLKAASTFALVGCTVQELKEYLERQFEPWMRWQNYGSEWHVDHIVQLCEFDLTIADEQRQAFHFSNLRPLEAHANVSKLVNLPRVRSQLPITASPAPSH